MIEFIQKCALADTLFLFVQVWDNEFVNNKVFLA
jgi:hypothetical protein